MRRRLLAAATLTGLALAGFGCSSEDAFPSADELSSQLKDLRVVASVVPEDATNALLSDPVKRSLAEALGDRFFHDDQWGPCNVSCASCHKAPSYADPGKAFSDGCGTTGRNSPTLLNVRYNRFFFWDGRADSAWSQATGPLQHPSEIGANPDGVKARMSAEYPDAYQALFGVLPSEHEPLTVVANFGKSVQAYLWTKKFVAVSSPFDSQLREFIDLAQQAIDTGDEGLQKQLEAMPNFLGLKTFVRKGQCIICHKNQVMVDDSFHNIGVSQFPLAHSLDRGLVDGYEQLLASPYAGGASYSDSPEKGQTKAANLFSDEFPHDQSVGAFKTPTLRNIEQTPPYMHNGSLETLEAVIDFYDRGGDPAGMYPGHKADTINPLDLEVEEKAALIDLLKSMTSDVEAP